MSQGLTILLLEDEPIIAMDIEEILHSMEFSNIVVCRLCSEALSYLEKATPDIAVIDIHLADGVCREIAEILHHRAVPFLVYSGLDPEGHDAGDVFLKGCWLSKPAPAETLIRTIKSCLT